MYFYTVYLLFYTIPRDVLFVSSSLLYMEINGFFPCKQPRMCLAGLRDQENKKQERQMPSFKNTDKLTCEAVRVTLHYSYFTPSQT